jgi:hypothetical protein
MRKVEIYVDNQILDLFDDEKIQVKSSVQDVNDIAKVFTDFSQSFYVPASDNNNTIFGFYCNNELDEFKANVRVACRIEIGLTPFRDGKLQLEGGVVKHNQVDAYKVTFYGEVVTLKDKFKEDKLNALDYSSINFSYTAANVKASIDSATYQDVRFPLISSKRVWTYDTGGVSAEDITIAGNAIVYTELFPAISDAKIMDLIASYYGVTFTGLFLTDDRFKNSYTWWKNREIANFQTEALDLQFNLDNSICDIEIPNALGVSVVNLDHIPDPADLVTEILTEHKLELFFVPNTAVIYYLDVYKNGAFFTTFSSSVAQLFTIVTSTNYNSLNDSYTFKARAGSALTFGFEVKYKYRRVYNDSFGVVDEEFTCSRKVLNNVIDNVFGFSNSAPDMKVSDWFSGTLKEFNLTCFPTAPLTFQIEPLEDWYANGELKDITEFVDTDNIDVDRLKLYNEISFEWEKSKAFYNVNYNSDTGREYGSLKNAFPNNDGGKYAIKLPFENLLFYNFDTINNNLQVAYCLEDATSPKPYIPKPVKLYLNTLRTCAFFLNNGITFEAVTEYMPFGQSTTDNFNQYSMNFGSEFDTLNLTNVNNSLYKTYYESYLVNLFNSRTRKLTLKCILPITFLTSLRLNDELLIRDKCYRINDMTSDLTTGVVQLVLINNLQNNRDGKTTLYEVPAGEATPLTVNAPINVPIGGYVTVADPVEVKFITSSPVIPATFTSPFTLGITVPVNTTGSDRYQTIYITGYNSSGTIIWTDTLIISQAGSDFFLLTESGGYLLQENLDKILL